jgi:hypothetical protein
MVRRGDENENYIGLQRDENSEAAELLLQELLCQLQADLETEYSLIMVGLMTRG